jgi:hypothetical protein
MSKGSEAVIRRRKKVKEMAVALFGGVCMICGYSRCTEAMDFHHIDPANKKFAPSKNGETFAWCKIVIELGKCALLCANCHRELHAGLIQIDRQAMLSKAEAIAKAELDRIKLEEDARPIRSIKCDCGRDKHATSAHCRYCATMASKRKKIEWPSIAELLEELKTKSFHAISKRLGVASHRTVKKYLEKNGINLGPIAS